MSRKVCYRKSKICKDLLFQSLRYTKSKYLFFKIHSQLLQIDERVDRVLNGRAEFGWTLTESHTIIIKFVIIFYKVLGEFHRINDKPAIIEPNGDLRWFVGGLLHRDGDKPAIIRKRGYGDLAWFKNGVEHRDDDKPAIIFSNGDLVWMKHGLKHRDKDKPAHINACARGSMYWFKNGKLHRDGDRYAIIKSNGYKKRYKNGESY